MASSSSMAPPPGEITQLLKRLSGGDRAAESRLVPLVYAELRRLAARYMWRERRDHTLQPTALVHEAYLKLIEQRRVSWQSRTHFFCVAARLMRRILVDHARQRGAAKRGGAHTKISLDRSVGVQEQADLDVVALDEALDALSKLDPQQARVIELRFFAGLTIEEISEALRISPATITRDWVTAKAWLFDQLNQAAHNGQDARQ